MRAPSPRALALLAGSLTYDTGKPCAMGHSGPRYAKGGACVECAAQKQRDWYSANLEKAQATRAAWRAVNAEKDRASIAKWQAANQNRIKSARLIWEAANPDKVLAKSAAYRARNPKLVLQQGAAWRKANRHKVNAKKARREAAKLQATPAWADPKKILEFYETADALGMWTGDWHHVDHMVPLQSKLVCGLHCEANLQILPGVDNQRKSNRVWPDMPLSQ